MDISDIFTWIWSFNFDEFFNFSGTEVKTESSVQDNFKPENLTSSNLQLKKNGFLVDYFIRPPITLKFKFEHEIWLSHINLETQVGQQNSKGIDVLIHDNNRVARVFLKQENQKEVRFQNFSFPGNRFKSEDDQNKIRLGMFNFNSFHDSFEH